MTSLPSAQRRTVVTTLLANGIEFYDFAVYGAMAPVLAAVLLPPGSGTTGLVAVFAVFATSFIARPVGAMLVGLRADRLGRRRALATMVLLMTAATTAIGLLPSWSSIGAAAPALLLLLRLVQGFCSGGEISTSVAFLTESVPARRWGWYGGWHIATVALGLASGIGVAGALSTALSRNALESWGWRLPFLVALPFGLVGLYVRLRLDDPEGSEPAARPRLSAVWRGHRAQVRTGFLLVGVLTGTFNMWFVYLPAQLADRHAHRLPVALLCAAGGLLATVAAAPVLGSLSDRVGRRPVLAAGTATLVATIVPVYLLANQRAWFALLLADLFVGAVLGTLAVSAYLADCFPRQVRATGTALTFGLATALLGGTAPLVGTVLAAAGVPLGVPLYVAFLSAVGFVACAPLGTFATRAPSPAAASVAHDPSGTTRDG